MDKKSKIREIVFDSLHALNEELSTDSRISVGPDTQLFGTDSGLDSLSLVSLIVDVEAGVNDAFAQAVSLTDDRAMSQTVSPYTSVESLVDYIAMIITEN